MKLSNTVIRNLIFAFVFFAAVITAIAVLPSTCLALPAPSTNAGLACTFPPTGATVSGNVAVCQLPALDASSCVEYHFIFGYSMGIAHVGVLLNGSTAYANVAAVPNTATQMGNESVFELRGEFCNITQTQQFILNGPLLEDTLAVTTPTGGTMSEDTSAGATLTLVLTGQRGFGNPDFMGGTVEVK